VPPWRPEHAAADAAHGAECLLECRTLRSPSPRPDGSADIIVTTTVQQQQNPVSAVNLVYVVGYGAETTAPMAGAAGLLSPTLPMLLSDGVVPAPVVPVM
jgi:hypothetical protein